LVRAGRFTREASAPPFGAQVTADLGVRGLFPFPEIGGDSEGAGDGVHFDSASLGSVSHVEKRIVVEFVRKYAIEAV
jgi:hypothetical protein